MKENPISIPLRSPILKVRTTQFTAGAFAGGLVGWLHNGTAYPTAMTIAGVSPAGGLRLLVSSWLLASVCRRLLFQPQNPPSKTH
ncbi:MAG TPA: hypothetical protein VLY20_03190 [Nitrospiria bacterium]|nr:hypothetical protein [Nitrospiria bacterium]HUK55644.1 hypothetical protein [Nitrospiria bacterium]